MTTMNKSLAVVAAVLVLFLCYAIFGARLQTQIVNERIYPATENAQLFEKALSDIDNGVLGKRSYAALESRDASDYSFIEIEISARSIGVLSCEWINASVTPLDGDIALVEYEMDDIMPFGSASARVTVLARAEEARVGHGVWLEYYVYGNRVAVDIPVRLT